MPRHLGTDWRAVAEARQRALVAVSGGADSVFLLHWLRQELPTLPLTVGHVNHGVRGPESDADEAFVQALAEGLGLPFHIRRLRRPSDSEADWRRERRQALLEMAAEAGAGCVFLGHHGDDIAEWFLMAALRGSGPTGLGGFEPISWAHGVPFIRPLEDWTRITIRHWLQNRGLPWRDDSSNESNLYRRNRIRRDVLPLLESIAPGATEGLRRAAEVNRRVARFYDNQAFAAIQPALLQPEPGAAAVAALDARLLPAQPDRDLLPGILRSFARLASNDEDVDHSPLRKSVAELVAERLTVPVHEDLVYQVGRVGLLLSRRFWLAHSGDEKSAWRQYRKALPFLSFLGEEQSINLDFYQDRHWIETEAGAIIVGPADSKPRSTLAATVCTATLRGRLHLSRIDGCESMALRSGSKLVAHCLKESGVPSSIRGEIWGFRDDEKVVWIPGVRQDFRTVHREGSPAVGLRLVRRE